MKHLELHTRHIPREHLREDSVMGKRVIENGLCDVIEPECMVKLHKCGVSCIETRLTWHELEPKPGVYDWSRFDRDAKKIMDGGMKLGVFPWFHHTPVWEKDMVRLITLEYGVPHIPSLWDSRLLETYDRLYGALKEHCGSDIWHIQCCGYGDYGEILYPCGIKHYKSLPTNCLLGHWSGDRLARADFARHLREKYNDSLDRLNRRWGSNFSAWTDNLMPNLPIYTNSLNRRIDFVKWYIGSLEHFCDNAMGVMRKHFPIVSAGIPLGSTFENLPAGWIKSRSCKLAGKHHMDARWTSLARFGLDTMSSQVLARRLSSAAHFYNTTFAAEAALGMPFHFEALYEIEANGGCVLQLDPADLFAGEEIYNREVPKIQACRNIKTPAAVFYPIEGEQCECLHSEVDPNLPQNANEGQAYTKREPIEFYFDACIEVAKCFDFDFVDTTLIEDSILDQHNLLIFPGAMPVPQKTAALIGAWVAKGGTLMLKKGAAVRILETNEDFAAYAERNNIALEIVEEYPRFPQYETLKKQFGANAVITCFDDGALVFKENRQIERVNF